MRRSSDRDERGRDVVHYYVGGLPDYGRLFWGLVVSAVGGVKMLRGLGWSCPVGVGKASGVVRN